jgi:hypothetical protein
VHTLCFWVPLLLTVLCSTGAGVGMEVLAWEAKAREKVYTMERKKRQGWMDCGHVIQTIGKEHLHCEQQIEQQDEPMTEAWWKGRWKRKECKFLRRQGPAKEKRNKKFDGFYNTISTYSRFLPLSAFLLFQLSTAKQYIHGLRRRTTEDPVTVVLWWFSVYKTS